MTRGNLSEAAERLLGAAMGLFSEKGYERTTVGEIQERAGLTFGSGALYKHFPSKQAVLEEGMARFVDSARHDRTVLGALDDVPVSDALAAIAQLAMSSFAQDRDALRIAWRDLDAFPDLQEKVRTKRIRATFDDFAAWLGHQSDTGRLRQHDSQAVAAVALSSLAFFQLLQFLMLDTPAGIAQDDFVTAWSQLFCDALAP
jgi:AcrR family transcriptional regulator